MASLNSKTYRTKGRNQTAGILLKGGSTTFAHSC